MGWVLPSSRAIAQPLARSLAACGFEIDQACNLADSNALSFDCRGELLRCGAERALSRGFEAGTDHWVFRDRLHVTGDPVAQCGRHAAPAEKAPKGIDRP